MIAPTTAGERGFESVLPPAQSGDPGAHGPQMALGEPADLGTLVLLAVLAFERLISPSQIG